jgi:hypothetical protein
MKTASGKGMEIVVEARKHCVPSMRQDYPFTSMQNFLAVSLGQRTFGKPMKNKRDFLTGVKKN